MIHVPDVPAALDWYARAFPEAERREVNGFTLLDLGGATLELVPADAKVASGAAGSVVYWATPDFEGRLAQWQALGAELYRGPMDIEGGQRMAQVRDPWGNLLGLRGPHRERTA
ncbi:VOC family protein [Deinococcus sp. NW-56]|uniref:VOC family protein n=1 Tax=Deinococcus sp. NW-56 TaxID=2080419 RepID=UPI000CF49DD5|nr:VOC family protein [Deinococcus sp. NW-56]